MSYFPEMNNGPLEPSDLNKKPHSVFFEPACPIESDVCDAREVSHLQTMDLLQKSLEVRPFHESDQTAMIECIIELQDAEVLLSDFKRPGNEMAEEYFASIYRPVSEGRGEILMAENDGQVSGFVAFVVEENDVTDKPGRHMYISDLVVLERFRGRGIAIELMKKAEAAAKKLGIKRVNIGVMVANQPALQLYLKLGYTPMYYSLWKEI